MDFNLSQSIFFDCHAAEQPGWVSYARSVLRKFTKPNVHIPFEPGKPTVLFLTGNRVFK